MDKHDFQQLILDYQHGRLSGEVKRLMDEWYASFEKGEVHSWTEEEILVLKNRLIADIDSEATPGKTVKRMWYWASAVAIMLVAMTLGYLFVLENKMQPEDVNSNQFVDVAPGGNKAILKLPDGQVISLDETAEGITINHGDILYSDGTAVISEGVGAFNKDLTQQELNTLTTPKGGKYSITLADGTRVWLNAETTLQYPTSFTGDSRTVVLDGEAYFEVSPSTKGAQHFPFRVKTPYQTVDVLGTHFNITAYSDERHTKTTLLTGKVRVGSTFGDIADLVPNQQSIVAHSKQQAMQLITVDPSVEIAWKNDMFLFHNVSLPDMMRDIQRWYDVQIDLSTIPNEQFYGEISMHVPLSEVLEMIQAASDYKFKLVLSPTNDKLKADGKNQERRVIMQ